MRGILSICKISLTQRNKVLTFFRKNLTILFKVPKKVKWHSLIDFVPPPSPGYVQRYITPTTIAFFSIVAKELFMTIIRVVHEGQNFKEAYNERQVTNPSFSKIGLEFKIFIMLKVSASFMVFVIFEGIVFCSKSCYENYDFYHWNCFNWWYFPLWLKNINWNESFYYQKLKKASIIWWNHVF